MHCSLLLGILFFGSSLHTQCHETVEELSVEQSASFACMTLVPARAGVVLPLEVVGYIAPGFWMAFVRADYFELHGPKSICIGQGACILFWGLCARIFA